ncbi:MAG: hypothetical protein ACI9ZX_002807 [Algoriphagus sp.]|jgi:hypothetical protein
MILNQLIPKAIRDGKDIRSKLETSPGPSPPH